MLVVCFDVYLQIFVSEIPANEMKAAILHRKSPPGINLSLRRCPRHGGRTHRLGSASRDGMDNRRCCVKGVSVWLARWFGAAQAAKPLCASPALGLRLPLSQAVNADGSMRLEVNVPGEEAPRIITAPPEAGGASASELPDVKPTNEEGMTEDTTDGRGGVDDLIDLTHLHEPAILHVLVRDRWKYAGCALRFCC